MDYIGPNKPNWTEMGQSGANQPEWTELDQNGPKWTKIDLID